MIKFGTDGWRGLIARDFSFENLQKVALATARLIVKSNPDAKQYSAVVGYDTRFLSKQFAIETACVLAWQGITVYLSDDFASTPQVSYHTKQKNVDLGIVITASHNPPLYNGYKVKANFGGPAKPEDIAALENELKKIWNKTPQMKFRSLDEYIKLKMIRLFSASESYLRLLRRKIDLDSINAANFKILYDPMHGAGINTIKHLLPNADEIHETYNPSFGEIDHPEPIAECLVH